MRKNYFVLSLVLITSFCTQAQVVNGNFENVKPNFLQSNWGMTFLQQFGFDPETGETFGDFIQFPWCIPSMAYASTDAKTGNYALEVANAYNVTQDTVIPGIATIFADPEQDGPGWNPGVPVAPGSSVIMLGFDYKFFPAGNDIAEARMEVTDEIGNVIGRTSVTINGLHNTYEYVYAPLTIINPGTPAFMFISFSMAKEGSTPTFGTRLLVDNVIVNFSALIVDENSTKGPKVFPTLVDSEINVIPTGFSNNVSYKIMNSEGKVVKQNTVNQDSDSQYTMNLSDLSSGIYFINIQDETNNSTKKFIKK